MKNKNHILNLHGIIIIMFGFIKQLLDWIYIRKCYFCKKPNQNGLMCIKCYEQMENILSVDIDKTKDVKIYPCGLYKENLRILIRAIKYHKKAELAQQAAEFMFSTWSELAESKESFEIVAVPMFEKRQKTRGYNHMDLIASEFAKLSGYSINKDLIKRVKETKPQYKLSKKERSENLNSAFRVDKSKYKGEKVLIIDDICTTGSTICEMTKELNKCGITNITGLVTAIPESSSTFQY